MEFYVLCACWCYWCLSSLIQNVVVFLSELTSFLESSLLWRLLLRFLTFLCFDKRLFLLYNFILYQSLKPCFIRIVCFRFGILALFDGRIWFCFLFWFQISVSQDRLFGTTIPVISCPFIQTFYGANAFLSLPFSYHLLSIFVTDCFI